MRAIVYYQYGSPGVLRCEEIETPTPTDNEVLIKVHAASVNPYDWHFMRGIPYFLRLMAGLRKPKDRRLGVDVAGKVEAVGRNVTQFKNGDEVFGACRGAFAEYARTSETSLAIKPENVSFEQAASVYVAALTALQGLRDKGQLQPGQKVLIHGAAGGVGTFAIQIAKWLGGNVTAVCSAKNVELVRSIGADRVVDYTKEDFTKGTERYDLVFDCIGNHSLAACRRVLNPKGRYIAVGGPRDRWMIGSLARMIAAPVVSRFVGQKLSMVLMKPRKEDLMLMQELMKTGKVRAVIDRRYSLKEAPEAIGYVEEGHARGKVVISLEGESAAPYK
ncbi:MAG TPA: NAD(P)-dependent alcohol dehydrogenase [Bryobacteraceae bacterium]|nr:NAD(P)-dependent alcohol dehydrogenase [Bryobacteraceae bacterium]